MRIIIRQLIILVVCVAVIQSDCDVCQSSNNVACHKETQYSLCINGIPTEDFITCPENHVCTPDPYVCYPLPKAKPICVRETNLCGVCSENKVYACVNETTIAFCYGEDKPYEGADVSYCLGDTVCDIYSVKGFCTESHLAKPSCVTTTTAETTTTTIKPPTPSKPRDPNTICRDAGSTGSYYADDPTCTTFVVCFLSGDSLTGIKKSCKAGQYFPPGAKYCSDIKPNPSCVTTEPITTVTESSTTEAKPSKIETTTEEPTTPSKPRDPNTICRDAGSTGSYYADDPTCTTFVVCFLSGDSLTGLKRTCKVGQYFPPDAKYCSDTKPAVCV